MLDALLICLYIFFLVPDVANADKAAGRIRRYKIIFTPQKVLPAVAGNFVLPSCADLFLLNLVCFSSTPVMSSWRSRGSLEVNSSPHFHGTDVRQWFSADVFSE